MGIGKEAPDVFILQKPYVNEILLAKAKVACIFALFVGLGVGLEIPQLRELAGTSF